MGGPEAVSPFALLGLGALRGPSIRAKLDWLVRLLRLGQCLVALALHVAHALLHLLDFIAEVLVHVGASVQLLAAVRVRRLAEVRPQVSPGTRGAHKCFQHALVGGNVLTHELCSLRPSIDVVLGCFEV